MKNSRIPTPSLSWLAALSLLAVQARTASIPDVSSRIASNAEMTELHHRQAPPPFDLRKVLAPHLEVIIDGENYPVPAGDPVEILQESGNTIELQSGALVNHAQTTPYGPVSSPTHIFVGLEDFIVQPSQPTPPQPKVEDTFSQLEGFAMDLVGLYDQVQPPLDGFAENKIKIEDLLGDHDLDLVNKLATIATTLDSFDRTLEGLSMPQLHTRDTGAFDINSFSPFVINTIANASLNVRPSLGYVRSLHNLFKVGVALSGPVQNQAKQYWSDHASKVVAVSGFASLALLQGIDWKVALDAALRTPGAGSATDDGPGDDPLILYFFSSKPGTSKAVFDQYCKSLAAPPGFLDSFDGNPWQGYQVELKKAQVADVRAQPWFDFIQAVPDLGEDKDDEVDYLYTDADLHPQAQNINETQVLEERAIKYGDDLYGSKANTPHHLKMLSAQPLAGPIDGQEYKFDDSLGEGVTIYIMDDGFEPASAELQKGPNNRKVGWHVVPNELSIPLNVRNGVVAGREAQLENIKGHSNHGTGVAIAATGLKTGVAQKANLNMLKFRGTVKTNAGLYAELPQLGAIHWAFSVIQNDINLNNFHGKAVVNFSWGIWAFTGQSVGTDSPLFKLFAKFENWCSQHGVVLVAAAGNAGGRGTASMPTGATLPQRLGKPDNSLITVGGVNENGWLWLQTSPEGASSQETDGLTGSISLYAQASGVMLDMSLVGQPPQLVAKSGTSIAAPIVAGLAAYFINKRPGNQVFTNNLGNEMKKALRDTAVHWPDAGRQVNVMTANNGAWGLDQALCARDGTACGKEPREPVPPPAPSPSPSPPAPMPSAGPPAPFHDCRGISLDIFSDTDCKTRIDTICEQATTCYTSSPVGWSSMRVTPGTNGYISNTITAFTKNNCGCPTCGSHGYSSNDDGCLNQFGFVANAISVRP